MELTTQQQEAIDEAYNVLVNSGVFTSQEIDDLIIGFPIPPKKG